MEFLELPKGYIYESENEIAGELFGKRVALQKYRRNSEIGFDVYFDGIHQFWSKQKQIKEIVSDLRAFLKEQKH